MTKELLFFSSGNTKTEVKKIDDKKKIPKNERDSFIDFSRFFHPSKWSSEDFTLYSMIVFIIILLLISIVNIVLFGLGFDASNQSAFGKTINGKEGIVLEDGFSKTNGFYIVSWILLFLSLIASVFQFMSNIFLIKFSKRFIWWNQISMFSFLLIDIVYGAWWIAISQIIGLVLGQQRYFAWDKQDKKTDIDPYKSQLNIKWLVIVGGVAVVFVLASVLLITPTIFTDNKEFYTYVEGTPSDIPNDVDVIESTIHQSGNFTTYGYTVESGLLYDVAPWWDMVVGIFQVSGLILLTRKTYWAWISFEVAMAAQMVVYFEAGNLILSIQSILLFISNLLPLYYWFTMNKKSARKAKQGIA
ncbi:MAG: hypothetical protein HPAVJP_0740 [Candidatus Hepatoplasma vulgare]|nr:MAG: hypothetical protein HPAVJP_0740 [Candidatus Hepatoplasma sp.]